MNLNKAFILGRLTRDPEVRNLPSGGNVASFALATNRVWSDKSGQRQDATEYHNIVVFGRLADICSQYLSKGRLVLIEGRIQTRSWQDKDGHKKYWTEIVAENMQMGPRSDGQRTDGQKIGAGQRNESNTSPAAPKGSAVGQEDIPIIEAEEPIKEEGEEGGFASAQPEKEEVDVKNIPF